MSGRAQLTVLNAMAARDFDQALATIASWRLKWVDLWGFIYGESVDALSPGTAARIATALADRGLGAYCLSSRIFDDTVEQDPQAFREKHLRTLRTTLAAAATVRPKYVRLIAGSMAGAAAMENCVAVLKERSPWVRDVYREAVDLILEAGFTPTLENEHSDCFLSTPEEFRDFFDWLDAPPEFRLTWDIGNSWQMGSYPTVEMYEALRPLLGYVHVKGGQAAPEEPARAHWNVGLDATSWPVREIISAVVAGGKSPVICLNPAHGEWKPDYDYGDGRVADTPFSQRDLAPVTARDIAFLRANVEGIEQ
ncbi:sugar phosphate isomerase/epimerase family protein [Nonomuraea insulae]|uniref:Sugar phosphate isomerase/epimerase family protein n=1 Tax=Nonomuraea insulae TaxID=1616787 RepID=A0ABW1D8J8_9ACTN